MAWICLALFGGFAISGRVIMKRYGNILTVFSAFYFTIIALGSMRLYGIMPASEQTYTVLIAGIISFSVGYLAIIALYQFRGVSIPKKAKDGGTYDYVLREKAIYVILLIVILYTVYRFVRIIGALRSGISFQVLRSLYFSENGGVNRFDHFVYLPLLQTQIILACIIFFSNKTNFSYSQKRRILIVTLACVVLAMFSNGGRETLFYTGLIVIYSYFLNNNHIKTSIAEWRQRIKEKKLMKYIIAIVVVGMILMTVLRSTTGESSLSYVFRKAYLYFSGWLPNFSERLAQIKSNDYTYGFSFILGVLRLPAAVIHRFLPESYAYSVAEKITSDLQEMVYIGGGRNFNAYVSLFYYFYRDFGFYSVVIESLIFGAVCANIEAKYLLRNNTKTLFWLLFVFFLIISSMIRWEMIHAKTAMILYYAPFCFKKTIRNQKSLHKAYQEQNMRRG